MPVTIKKKTPTEVPDHSEASAFLASAFPTVQAHTFLTLDDREIDFIHGGKKSKKKLKDPNLTRELHGSLKDCWSELCALNEIGAGVFYAVNQTDLKGRKKENIKCVRAVWHEDDDGWSGTFPIDPHSVIETSPGRYQRLWLVDGLSFEEFESVMETMVVAYGSDKNAKDLTRVLRLPGTYHRKGVPFQTWVTKVNKIPPYTREEIVEAFPQVPKAPASFKCPVISDVETKIKTVIGALDCIEDDSWITWITFGKILKDEFGDAGFEPWLEWSKKSPKFVPGECEKEWAAFKMGSHQPTTLGTVYWMAKNNGWSFPKSATTQQTGGTSLELVIELFQGEGNVHLNRFNGIIELADVPWSGSDHLNEVDIIRARRWAHEKLGKSVGKDIVYDALAYVADDNGYDPLMDYLESQKWDGEPRLDAWLVQGFGAADNTYNRAVGRMYLLSAVARALKPGCKVDTALVLEGEQGVQKSMTLRALAGDEWFSDSISPMENKDAVLDLQGKWVVEISDLSTIKRSGIEAIKAFLSRQVDHCRPPYGRVAQDYPRRCVLVGTTNEAEYLKDSTGNRRFWPVSCTKASTDWVKKNRDQLWAEAVHAYKAGEKWWPTDSKLLKLIREEQAKREQVDPWLEEIADFCDGKKLVSISQVLTRLDIKAAQQTKVHQDRIAGCLKSLGWERRHLSFKGKKERPWGYTAPGVNKISKKMKEEYLASNGSSHWGGGDVVRGGCPGRGFGCRRDV